MSSAISTDIGELTRALESCIQRAKVLQQKGFPVSALNSLIRGAREVLISYGRPYDSTRPWLYKPSPERVAESMGAVEGELDRLENGDQVDLLVDALMGGYGYYFNVSEVRKKLEELHIRSGGFIEVVTDDQLAAFYRRQVQHVRSMTDLHEADLRLRLEDYAPAAVLADPELNLAPSSIQLANRRGGLENFEVKYEDGECGPIGIVKVPVNVFRASAKLGEFPVLPHGIKLRVIVVHEDRRLAAGFVHNHAHIARMSKQVG